MKQIYVFYKEYHTNNHVTFSIKVVTECDVSLTSLYNYWRCCDGPAEGDAAALTVYERESKPLTYRFLCSLASRCPAYHPCPALPALLHLPCLTSSALPPLPYFPCLTLPCLPYWYSPRNSPFTPHTEGHALFIPLFHPDRHGARERERERGREGPFTLLNPINREIT